ncbi:HEPN domain-containing protein [Candidatus Margulisiibacteriota bacterium]
MSAADCQEWITLAGHDVDTVKLLIEQKGHADIIIYHIHQATEKLLKALIIKAGKKIEKTHHLDKLLSAAINIYSDLSKIEDNILAINIYLPKLRYPMGDVISFEEALDLNQKFSPVRELIDSLLS